jgi:uncharacterized protein (TIGR02646 family)
MLQLVSKNLSVEAQALLDDLQMRVNNEVDFEHKVAKAQALWRSKGGQQGKLAFSNISAVLKEMCVYVEACNYCEHNESNDIEHIDPKSYFPDKTFVWQNYLRACKQCNSGYKLDSCFVLDDDDNVVEILRGVEPPFKTIAFINPRTENPNTFMILNTLTYSFDLMPDLSKRDTHKAIKTLAILQLNNRDLLIQARKNAAVYLYQRMKLLADLIQANSIAEIENLLSPHDDALIDKTLSLAVIKTQVKNSFQKHITTYAHPSVWYAIKKVSSKTEPKWAAIFDILPEALNW